MSYKRPSGGTFNTIGPEIDEVLRQGTSSTYTYEGTYAEMVAQRNIERFAGANRINLRPNGSGLWQLQASYPWNTEDGNQAPTDEPQNLHEIEIQVASNPIWNSETLRLYLSDDDIAITRAYAEKFLGGQPLSGIEFPTKAEYITELASKTTSDANATLLFNRATSGTDSFIEYLTVYRRTITAANYIQVQASYEGAGQVWLTSEVEAFEGIPNNEWFGLVPGAQWLKAPPSVQAVAGGKTQIQYYYTQFKQATKLLYPAYGGATLADDSATAI